MRSSKKPYIITFFFLSIIFISCDKPENYDKEVITIKGSDTMVNLTQLWAEEYMKINKKVTIQVNGGGSGTGIAALLNGVTDIANLSRDLSEREYINAQRRQITPLEHKVALDGIAVVVHPSNPIDTLSLDQLKMIFSGDARNWKTLGWLSKEIILYGRENSSGTYEFFKSKVLGKNNNGRGVNFDIRAQALQGTAAVGEAIARDVYGIGYGGVGYFAGRNDVKILYIKETDSTEAIAPAKFGEINYEAIWTGQYPIARYLYCFTNGDPKQSVTDFINFILSKRGQIIVAKMEYIPLPNSIM